MGDRWSSELRLRKERFCDEQEHCDECLIYRELILSGELGRMSCNGYAQEYPLEVENILAVNGF